jgi:hypothetical protein
MFTVTYVEVVTSTLKMEAIGMIEISEPAPYISLLQLKISFSTKQRSARNLSGSYTFTVLVIT